MAYFKIQICLAVLWAFVVQISATGCNFDIILLNERHPLLLVPGTDRIIYPVTGSSIIRLKNKELVEFTCLGLGEIQIQGKNMGSQQAIAECLHDTFLSMEGERVDFNDILCSRRITSVARFTSNICWNIYREIEVGFELSDGRFIYAYTTCFDYLKKNVVYTYFLLSKDIAYQTVGNSRPGWTEGGFYNLSSKLDLLYTKDLQRETINRQVGLDPSYQTYIKPTGNYYLAKGHLIAKTDFIFNAEQQATFHYINSVPQWQTFNALNWFSLEKNLRNFASNRSMDLEVYTGSYGISTLPHSSTGVPVPLYLFVDDFNEKSIPVVELIWKLAYSKEHKAGIVVLGINNPYQLDIDRSIICDDISGEISFLNFDLQNIQRGYMYACTVDSLRKVIKDIPKFDIRKLLT